MGQPSGSATRCNLKTPQSAPSSACFWRSSSGASSGLSTATTGPSGSGGEGLAGVVAGAGAGGGAGGRVLLVAVVAVGVVRLPVPSLGRVAVLLRVPLLLQLRAMMVEEGRDGGLRLCPWMGNVHSGGWIRVGVKPSRSTIVSCSGCYRMELLIYTAV